MRLNEIVRSKGYKNFMAKLYGWGAAVVIIGALFKINHFPLANQLLILGMGTEAIIFFFSAFEPLHEEVDWTLVYPELAGMEHAGGVSSNRRAATSADEERILSDKLDKLLKAAQIDAQLIDSLSVGLNKLNVTAKNLNASSDIMGVNTNYAAELTKLTENLGRLNILYAKQLETSSRQMDATIKAQENMNRIAETLAGTLEKSTRYKNEIGELSENVSSLNKIYGGMLTAVKSAGK